MDLLLAPYIFHLTLLRLEVFDQIKKSWFFGQGLFGEIMRVLIFSRTSFCRKRQSPNFWSPHFNPYLLHVGNIQERHLWKKNPKFIFWSLMTSYIADYLWRHMNLKLHQLGYLYVTWPKSRDVISVRYHVMKVITPEKPETELASFLEKKIQTRLGTFGFFG